MRIVTRKYFDAMFWDVISPHFRSEEPYSLLYQRVIKGMHVYNLYEVIFPFIMAQEIVRPTAARSCHSCFWEIPSVERCVAVLRERRLGPSRRNLLSTKSFHSSSTSPRTASLPKRLITPITSSWSMAIYLLKPPPPRPAIYQLCQKLHRAHSNRNATKKKISPSCCWSRRCLLSLSHRRAIGELMGYCKSLICYLICAYQIRQAQPTNISFIRTIICV